MNKVRLGVIGLGAQGGTYAGFAYEGKVEKMELGAICDIDPAKKEVANEKYPEVPFFDNYIEMMESGKVDAIITTVPHYLHPEMAIEALKRDMPVIVEKPAGVYTKQVRRMNEFAKSKPNVPFAIMFNQRTNPLYKEVKKIVDSGALGELRRTNWIITNWWRPQAYYDQSAWRATWGGEGGGVLVNQAPHQLDMIQWICGKPSKVYANAQYGSHRNIVVENDVTALFEYENGATGVFITCTHDCLGTDRFEIVGDKGKIVIEDSKRAIVKILKESETEMNKKITWQEASKVFSQDNLGNVYDESVIEFSNAWGSQHINVLENFASHIIDGTPLLAPGDDGMNGVKLANAILLSSWLGEKVDYDFDEDVYVAELNKKIATEGKFDLIND